MKGGGAIVAQGGEHARGPVRVGVGAMVAHRPSDPDCLAKRVLGLVEATDIRKHGGQEGEHGRALAVGRGNKREPGGEVLQGLFEVPAGKADSVAERNVSGCFPLGLTCDPA